MPSNSADEDVWDRILREYQESLANPQALVPPQADSFFPVFTGRRMRRANTSPGGRGLNYPAEQRILVAPSENSNGTLTYMGDLISIDTVREGLGLPGIAQGTIIEPSNTRRREEPPMARFQMGGNYGPWVAQRRDLYDTQFVLDSAFLEDPIIPTRGLSGHSGETIELTHLDPPKPDYEIVTDEVLLDLILEHVKPWFDSRAKVDIRIDKLEKVNIPASPNRYRVYAGYQYKETNTIKSKMWRQATLWVTNTGEVQS